MKRLAIIVLAVSSASCAGIVKLLPPPPGPPDVPGTPPTTTLPGPTKDPSPVCWRDVQRACGCWHRPPGQDWQLTPACDAPPTTQPPAPGACAKIAGPGECIGLHNEPATPITSTLYGAAVDAALAQVTGCQVGDDCTAGDGGAKAQKEATLAVMRLLKAQGFCVTYDVDHGNAGGLNSEMGVRRDAQTIEWFQILSSAGKVRWSLPGGVRGRCSPPTDEESIEEVERAWKIPPAAPPPASPPATPPSPGQGESGCSFTLADVTEWRTQVHPVTGTQTIDSTPQACNFRDPPRPPCDHPHGLARCCLLAEEKGNQGCADKLFGSPTWSVVAGDVRIVTPWAGTSTKVKVAEGSGLLKLEGSADPRTKVCIRVIAGSPACAVKPDGGCLTEACP